VQRYVKVATDAAQERLLRDVLAIARIPAPTFSESARMDWIERRLGSAPGTLRRDDVGNLLWTWGTGRPDLMLAAHVDTVFGPETVLSVRREGSWLVGPGVGDNAAAIAVAIDVVEELLARRPLKPGAVAFTVGEEGLGNLVGASNACEELQPRAFVALEGHMLDRVLVDAVASARLSVVIRGPGGHPWEDRGRPSALHALLRVGSTFVTSEQSGLVVNVGLVAGGRTVNTIADRAELVLDARSLDEAALDALVLRLERTSVEPPLVISVELVGRRPGGRLPRDAELLQIVRRIRDHIGLPDSLGAGSTDANAALARCIPALTLGVARGQEMHALDERIDVESLALGRRQVEELVSTMLVG
jgi:acetylornithine deacetylase/succinyl-diaminopimelate desuccinylase-like protein